MPEHAREVLSSYRNRLAVRYVALVALLAVAWGWSLYARPGLLMMVVVLLIAVVLAIRFARTAIEPVLRLAESAEAMAAGRLEVEIPHERGDLGVLSDALSDLRRQMRARLENLEGRESELRLVIDGLQDAVFLLQGTTITLANRSASDMFKVPLGGWTGQEVGDALPGSLVGALSRALESAADRFDEEIGPDPTQRYLRLATTRLKADEHGERTLVVVRDITERMRLEQMRRDFVANASHELKTPAAGIQLLAESALSASEDGDTDQSLDFVRQLKDEAERLRQMVLDLLDLSRLETVPAPGAVTDLRNAVQLAMVSHRLAATRKGLELALDSDSVTREDVFAKADKTDVAVAIDNLLDNAIAYTESGNVTVRLSADETTVTLTVADTGVGIPAEDLPRVFERFYRVDRSRDRRSGGTGLGLSLVKHVVERSDGQVTIGSEQGRGTEVAVRLHRAR